MFNFLKTRRGRFGLFMLGLLVVPLATTTAAAATGFNIAWVLMSLMVGSILSIWLLTNERNRP